MPVCVQYSTAVIGYLLCMPAAVDCLCVLGMVIALLCLVTSARGSGREERHRRCVVLPTTVVCMVMHVMPRG